MERALLVSIKFKSEEDNWGIEDIAQEIEELAKTSGVEIVDNIHCHCEKPTPNFFIGSGKTKELALISQEENIDVLIFSHDLSGTQQRNLEEVINKKTIDRTQIILDIFAKRALTLAGRMQVELAQLQYLLPRLTGKGIILSRLGGGIGTSGPGEKKLEMDRRRLRQKINHLRERLADVVSHRITMKKKRKEHALPTVALVGYTNAGKSTLINSLTEAGQIVSDRLFTTLDPLSKILKLPNGENILISDTVGFLHNLPHRLIEAFKGTLEEVVEADALIHVLDASSPLAKEYSKAVFEVLKQLGADQKPIITALNKIDLLTDELWPNDLKEDFSLTLAKGDQAMALRSHSICISAKFKKNLDFLLNSIQEIFESRMIDARIAITHSRMYLIDLLYREGKVKDIKYGQKEIRIQVSLPRVLYHRLLQNGEIALTDEIHDKI